MYTTESLILVLIISLLILILLFFLFREINCWYWKINERIKLQKEIISLLKKLTQNNESSNIQAQKEIENLSSETVQLQLTFDENAIVEKIKSKGLKQGDKIIMHKTLRSILKVSEKEWNNDINYQKDWIIIYQ